MYSCETWSTTFWFLDSGVISFKSELAPQHHAEIIIPMIDDLLKESSLTKNDLDGIVLSQGPGSFTGVRIAASTAQGLALGLDKKVALVTSLEALAIEACLWRFNTFVPMIQAIVEAPIKIEGI